MLPRRSFLASALAAPALLASARNALVALESARNALPLADYSLEIAPCSLDFGRGKSIQTIAYNGRAPGPLLRLKEDQPVTIDIRNRTRNPEVVHWHGLFLPPFIDGALEEGTPAILPGAAVRLTFVPHPPGFRWFHTHMFAGRDLKKGQYTGLHGFLYIEPRHNPGRYDAEFFLALHDWKGQLLASDDGSMNPAYDISTINGRVLGSGDPLRVRPGQRVLFHTLNSSPTELHWLAFSGHQFDVIALDGNPVPTPRRVPMLRLAPAERVTAIVQMNNPGVWVLGEVRKHIQAAGMGIVVEYSGSTGLPQWQQPESLLWDYLQFENSVLTSPAAPASEVTSIPLVIRSRFTGHGDLDHWTINGKSFPHTDTPVLHQGRRYRLKLINQSSDDHPVHLHRHVFELRGILKDTVLVPAHTRADIEFDANDPGLTLFHCHQQDHMDSGFMMLLRYA